MPRLVNNVWPYSHGTMAALFVTSFDFEISGEVVV